ncbi:hypothetical protein ASD03_01505 [Ensifer sp. Root127]|nr:hypothetical protein ASD03_01505 [Ensifer sp. Root127]
MIVQSTRIGRKGGVRYLARHLLDKFEENDRIEVLAGDRSALHDAQALAEVKQCKFSVRHLSVSPEREMTPVELSEFIRAIDAEFRIGPDRPRLVVRHVKKGRSHFHVAVAEVDPTTLRVLDCRHDYARLEDLARRYEEDHGETAQPSRAERRARRTEGFSDVSRKRAERVAPKFDRARLRQAAARGYAAFVQEIGHQGLQIADGDKGLILITPAGAVVAAANRAAGMKRGEFQSFLQGGIENERLIGSQTRVPERPRDGGKQHSAPAAASLAAGDAGTIRPDRSIAGIARPDPGRPAPASERIERPHHKDRSAAAAIGRLSREALFLHRLTRLDLDDLLRRAREFAASIRSMFEPERDRLARQIVEAKRTRKSFPPAEAPRPSTPSYDFRWRVTP